MLSIVVKVHYTETETALDVQLWQRQTSRGLLTADAREL